MAEAIEAIVGVAPTSMMLIARLVAHRILFNDPNQIGRVALAAVPVVAVVKLATTEKNDSSGISVPSKASVAMLAPTQVLRGCLTLTAPTKWPPEKSS